MEVINNVAPTSNEDMLSIKNYQSLSKWLVILGIVPWTDDLGPFIKDGKARRYIVPLIMPLIFVVSTVFQDLTCYGALSGCDGITFFAHNNPTYNMGTIYGWVGLILAASTLHASMLSFARTGKLETLFNQVPNTTVFDGKVRKTIAAWVVGWVGLVIVVLITTTAFLIYGLTQADITCSRKHLVCLVPQSIQIISGLSMVFTGVGLSTLTSSLLRMDIMNTLETSIKRINEEDLKGQLQLYVELKERVKKLGTDTQLGNAIAFCAACLCIFGSFWTFIAQYVKGKDHNLVYDISLWMCIVSLALTFIAVFAFSYVTQACDQLLERTQDAVSKYVAKKELNSISLLECFVTLGVCQQRFGFTILGVLVEPEIVRAGAYLGVTAAVTIFKLSF